MTKEQAVYAEWLDVLGSGTEESEELHDSLHHLHEVAEESVGTDPA